MEKSTKKLWLSACSKIAALLCFCLALSIVLFPGSAVSTAASGEVQAVSTQTARAVPRTNESKEPPAQIKSEMLIPLGRTTGIKMFSEGAMVVDFSQMTDGKASPARSAGVEVGDVIIALDNNEVTCNEDLINHLAALEQPKVTLTFKRGGETKTLEIETIFDAQNNTYKLGAWVRDSIAGIGTITFVDPQNGAFGALGHGISDADTGRLMEFESGSIMESSVVGVKRGEPGAPGELTGAFNLDENQGVLYANTDRGIFGRITQSDTYNGLQAIPIAHKDEIKEGKAYILSNVDGELVERFDIEIVRVYAGGDGTRDMMVRILDERLISITGGIVQGMSGSPIVQNGKLIGAVTHVLINDPTRGYGIAIENMLAGLAA